MSQTSSTFLQRLARSAARAFLLGAALVALGGCDLLIGNSLPDLPQGRSWQVVPLRALLTRPTIHVDAMAFCRVSACGYDAVVARFSAGDGEARILQATLDNPARLAALVRKPRPNVRAKPANVKVERFSAEAWKGVRIAIVGGPKERRAYGVVLSRRADDGLAFVIAVAASPDLAQRLATTATE